MATGDTKRFVNRGVIVQIVENAVAPHIAPAVGAEQTLDGFLWLIVIDVDRGLVDHERKDAVGDETIVREDEGERSRMFDSRHG